MRVQHRRDARVPRIATRAAKKITTDLSTTRLPLHPFPSSPKWHIPACGVSLLFGNFYYAWLATRLATKENRTNVTAQPYGLNTTVIFIILYGMCLPALEAAADKFAPDATATDAEMHSAARQAAEYGWKVSVAANFIIGVFEMCGFFLGDLIRWAIPTAAVYIPLAGVGFVYLAFSPMISIAKEPMMCFLPLVVVVVGFFGNVRYPLYGKITIPVAFLAIAIATISGWAGACQHSRETITYGFGSDAVSTSVAEFYNGKDPLTDLPYKTCTGTDPTRAEKAYNDFAFKGDILGGFGKGLAGLGESELMGDWVAPSLLFGIIGFLGTMACVESAEAAGDSYPMAECMIADGLGTCIGALSGGMFPTTVYIGYPVYKALGAKIGYSMLNGVSYFILLSTGLFAALYNVIPGCANSAILVFVGLLLSRQAFEETPPRHYPCLLLGLMPFICNYMALDSDGHHSVNMGVQMMAPGGGAVFGVVLATVSCFAIDRKFEESAVLSLVAAILSVFGIFASHNDLVDLTNGVRGPEHQTIGVYDASEGRNNGWRWSVAWTLCAAFFACHVPFQSGNPRAFKSVLPPRIEDDDTDPYDTKAAAPTVEKEIVAEIPK